jgi:hypothetical protein
MIWNPQLAGQQAVSWTDVVVTGNQIRVPWGRRIALGDGDINDMGVAELLAERAFQKKFGLTRQPAGIETS